MSLACRCTCGNKSQVSRLGQKRKSNTVDPETMVQMSQKFPNQYLVHILFANFYFSRKCNCRRVVELFGLIIINIFMLHGEIFLLNIGSIQLPYSLQGLAIFSLIPIWLYKGKQGC